MEVRAFPLATNHRFDRPDDPVQAQRFRSSSGRNISSYCSMISRTRTSLPGVPARAASSSDYANGFGTLYTADYRPDSGEVHYRWPGTSCRAVRRACSESCGAFSDSAATREMLANSKSMASASDAPH